MIERRDEYLSIQGGRFNFLARSADQAGSQADSCLRLGQGNWAFLYHARNKRATFYVSMKQTTKLYLCKCPML